MRSRSSLPAALVLALALLVAGCSSDGSDGADDAATTTTVDTAVPETTPTTAATTIQPAETTMATTATTEPVDEAGARLQLRPVLGSQPCSAVNPDDPDTTETTIPDPAAPELVPDVAGATCYGLGPVGATGSDLTEAEAVSADEDSWLVNVRAVPGSVDALNALFDACATGAATCPATGTTPGAVAIVLDGVVRSAPSVQSQGLADDVFQISGGFTQAEAQDLAALLSA